MTDTFCHINVHQDQCDKLPSSFDMKILGKVSLKADENKFVAIVV